MNRFIPDIVRVHLEFFSGSCYGAQISLKLRILLPQSPKRWDYRRGTHLPPVRV